MLIACSCLGSLGMLTTNYRRATQGTKASLKFRHKHIQTLNMFMHTHLGHDVLASESIRVTMTKYQNHNNCFKLGRTLLFF